MRGGVLEKYVFFLVFVLATAVYACSGETRIALDTDVNVHQTISQRPEEDTAIKKRVDCWHNRSAII